MEFALLFFKTIAFRPYVFAFLAAFLVAAVALIGWPRTWRFWLISWATAFVCEYSSTRTGIPFGWYHYNGSTVGQELYFSNIPFMDSISFSFLLYASYCLALLLLLPIRSDSRGARWRLPDMQFDLSLRTSWSVFALAVLLFAFIDMVIDPVALRGTAGSWARSIIIPTRACITASPWPTMSAGPSSVRCPSGPISRSTADSTHRFPHTPSTTHRLLLGVGLYYGVLAFNLAVTFWIGEALQGTTGLLMYVPVTALLLLRLFMPATHSV